jgi:hypothetical protein
MSAHGSKYERDSIWVEYDGGAFLAMGITVLALTIILLASL